MRVIIAAYITHIVLCYLRIIMMKLYHRYYNYGIVFMVVLIL